MRLLYFILLFLVSFQLGAQDSLLIEENKPKKWAINGYVKNMQTLYIIDSLNPVMKNAVLLDNLVHHRLNFSWYLHKNWELKVDMRNRIFTGELMKLTPNYGNLVDSLASNPLISHKAWYSPSWLLVNRRDLVIHSMLDRFYVNFSKGDWEVRLGRQRINWGISNMWNPHDIFNAYNFTDFDYEERPGTDGLRITRYTGMASKIELAVQAFDKFENLNAGLLYQFNKWNYDFQAIAAIYQENLVAGLGWAGGIKNVGFKGELSYFYALKDSVKHSVAASVGFDYLFSNNLFLSGGLLYNSNGKVNSNIGNLFGFRLSAKNLYPFPYNFVVALGIPISPILSSNISFVYSPSDGHPVFISPSFRYSIKENWDIDLVGQIIMGKDATTYKSPMQLLFLRLKWSY